MECLPARAGTALSVERAERDKVLGEAPGTPSATPNALEGLPTGSAGRWLHPIAPSAPGSEARTAAAALPPGGARHGSWTPFTREGDLSQKPWLPARSHWQGVVDQCFSWGCVDMGVGRSLPIPVTALDNPKGRVTWVENLWSRGITTPPWGWGR